MLGVHTVGELIDYPLSELADPMLVGNRAFAELARLELKTTDHINYTVVIDDERSFGARLSSVMESDYPIELLDISHAAYAALKKAGIVSIGELFAADSMPAEPLRKPAPEPVPLSGRSCAEGAENKSEAEIDVLELSSRSYKALRRSGIRYISQLQDKQVADLFAMRNLGEQSAYEIVTKYREYMGMEPVSYEEIRRASTPTYKTRTDIYRGASTADTTPINIPQTPAVTPDRTVNFEAETSSDGDVLGKIMSMQRSGEISVDEMVYYYEHPDEFLTFLDNKNGISQPVFTTPEPEIIPVPESLSYGISEPGYTFPGASYSQPEITYGFDESVTNTAELSPFTAEAIGISEDTFAKLADAGILSFEQLKKQDLSSLMMLMIDITDVYTIINKCNEL